MKTSFAPKADEAKHRHQERSGQQDRAPGLAEEPETGVGVPLFLQQLGWGADGGHGSPLQTKLEVGPPDDPLEHEADRVADRASAGNGTTPESGRGGARPMVAPAATSVPGTDSGHPLSVSVRERIEPVVGVDMSNVRVHSGLEAAQAARSLKAKAFTHGTHIWLGPGQSTEDTDLLAHEVTHVVQQSGPGQRTNRIQRSVEEYTHPEDTAAAAARSQQRINDELEEHGDEEAAEEAETAETPGTSSAISSIDRSEVAKVRGEEEPVLKPSADRPGQAQPQAEQASTEVEAEADSPAEPLAEGEENAAAGEEGAAAPPAATPAAQAAEAFAAADSIVADPPPPAVIPPVMAAPVDAGGQPLPPNPLADAQTLGLVAKIQMIRDLGQSARQGAAEYKANANVLRGNLALARGSIEESQSSVDQSKEHLTYRREVLAQGREVLTVSEEKAQTVADQAPDVAANASEGRGESEPMASEASTLASENAANTPDDAEAAAKSQEAGGEINTVSSDSQSMDSALSQTETRAQTLSQEAAQAQETNAQSAAQFDQMDETLGQTDAKLAQMTSQNDAAMGQVNALESGPDQVMNRAQSIDQEGLALINHSMEMEAELLRMQAEYESDMAGVPAYKPEPVAPAEEEGGLIQRQPATAEKLGYEGRINLGLDTFVIENVPSILTGVERPTERQRREAFEARERRRADHLAIIDTMAGEDFNRLDALDKAGIAAMLMFDNLFHSLGETNWPGFFGHLLQGLVDPRVGLMGIVSGLSMTLSGVANLFSAEQWERDPLGNLLKSAADIATGITIVLGSVTMLLTAAAVILTAVAIVGAIFSFGAVAAALAPLIAWLWSAVGVVGGLALKAAAIALYLQLAVLIKNLIDAACAETATELLSESEQMTTDATNAGNMLLIIAMAKAGEAGARTPLGQRAMGGVNNFLGGYGIPSPFPPVPPRHMPPGAPGEAPAGTAGEAPTVRPQETAPVRPVEEAAPVRPAEEGAPVRPAEEAAPPGPMEEVAPPRPAEETVPSKPAEEPAPTPVEEVPAKPVEEAPVKPAEEVPPKPVEETPAKPVEEAPKPAEETPPVTEGEAKPGSPEAETTAAPETVPPAPEPGAPGSPEHKAARWAEYQARTGGEGWSYERWSNVYEANMTRATKAHEAVNAYHEELGWGQREVTVDVEGVPRRLDIADPATLRGVEHKTGYQYASESNLWEVARDQILVEQGWDITWVFEGRASKPLLNALDAAGINYIFR